jgi:hypothetical protein
MKLYPPAILAAAFLLTGCGVSTPSANSAPANSGITGNWQLTLTSTTGGGATGGSATYGIYLTQTGNAVSGILAYQQAYPLCVPPTGPPCAFPFGEIALELVGTVDKNGNIVLNSVPDSGGPAAFSVTASTADNTTFSGTYSITLVDTSPPSTWTDQGTISGNAIGNLNGTYSGTVTSSTGLSMDVTTTLSQTSSPDSAGGLEVSGSANFTGLQCFTSATVPSPGGLLGSQLVIDFVPTNSPTTTIILSGTLSQDAKTIAATYEINGGCGSDTGGGTLTLQ